MDVVILSKLISQDFLMVVKINAFLERLNNYQQNTKFSIESTLYTILDTK